MISGDNSKQVSKHKKHTDLKRPSVGNFGRNEWAIVGAPCATIKLLADRVIAALSPVYRCAYVDSAHNDETALIPGRLANGAVLEYTNEVNYTQIAYKDSFNKFELKKAFAGVDLVIANGNHHTAKAQVIIIDENKKASLQKRLSQLTDVQMVLLAGDATEVFDFIKESITNWQALPVYKLDETEKIISFFRNKLAQAKPKLNGLVLSGGKSIRMGFDKGSVNWHGQQQRYYMADLLKNWCDEVYISCRPDQQNEIDAAYLSLPDTFTGFGPYGGILSAFREQPDNAWLVVACDLPLLSEKTLDHLVDNRNPSTIATAFQSSFEGFPEPLITIWEPKSYPVLLSFLAQGYSCPRKVLINSDITLLNAPDPTELANVNTPGEFESVKNILHQKIAAE